MCQDKKGSSMNNLIGERLAGIESVQAANLQDNLDVQAIFNAQLNELRTRLTTSYEEIAALTADELKNKIGILTARLNDFGSRLKIVEDITADIQTFIVDHGGL